MLKKSPGGSVFPYYYKGGEIHCLKYGCFGGDEKKLFELMNEETAFIQRRPASRLRIWVDFYETQVTDHVLQQFADQAVLLQAQIVKLALVGLNSGDKKMLSKRLKERSLPFPFEYFSDPEDAKTWLVGC